MSVSAAFQRYILEQLAELGGVTARSMFGGVGLYHEALFFALLDDDTLYMKVGEINRADYAARGMKPFCPFPDKPAYEMGYYEVPADVLEDPAELAAWARKSCDVALAAQLRKPSRRKSRARGAKKKAASKSVKPTGKRARPKSGGRK